MCARRFGQHTCWAVTANANMDRREQFSSRLAQYLIGRGLPADGGAVKRHTFRNGESAEYSLSADSAGIESELIAASSDWPLIVERCETAGGRLRLYLDRISSIERCLKDSFAGVLRRTGSAENLKPISVSVEDEIPGDLSHFRVRLLAEAAERLATFKGHRLVLPDCDEPHVRIFFGSNSSLKPDSNVRVVCGPVLNGRTGSKETDITADQYLEKRVVDMKLKSQHKYRVIVTDETRWEESLLRLGRACAAVDLLQIKPSHPVRVNANDGGSGCSRGAAFVLYNSARLSCIINAFNEKVTDGTYPPLPPLDEIDFSVLHDEDEWNIMYNYIMDYPGVLESGFRLGDGTCHVETHRLCSFLNNLVGKFSVYYRRIRILLEPREHLMPKIYARIYLLMSIREVIAKVLSIFNIEILTEM